jgi:exosome complex RNA-binding protein Csl4
MEKMSLISTEITQMPLQTGQRFSHNTEIIVVKQQEDNALSPQTVRQKPIKLAASKQEPATAPQIIYGRILEIKKNIVTLRCLMVEDEQVFEIMSFDKKNLKKTVNLAINQLVEIKINTSQGEIKYTFANSNRQDLTEKFRPKDYFSKHAGSVFFQSLPLHIDEDNF